MTASRHILRVPLVLACATALGLSVSPVRADTVNATLAATYYEVLNGTGGPDFGGSGFPNVAVGSSLGPNGLPVVTAGSEGISEFNPVTEEITWWSPAMNSAVKQTSLPGATISLPFDSNMYPPNSTGGSDSAGFETAQFGGTFTLAASSVVSFQLGSDDDSFIYVDGKLIGQNPGIHGVSNVNFDSPTLSPGVHTLNVFFADREETGAALSLNLLSSGVVITPTVPEPQSWALMATGLGFFCVLARRRRRAS